MALPLHHDVLHQAAGYVSLDQLARPSLARRQIIARERCGPRPFCCRCGQGRSGMQGQGELQDGEGEGQQDRGDQRELDSRVATIGTKPSQQH